MSAQTKKAQQLARQFFRMSVVDGVVSPERVAGVLEYIEKHKVAQSLHVLETYHRLVARELAKSHALVEHAGSLGAGILDSIAASMTARYGRKISATAKPNASLIAGVRVRIGDDVYENSIAARLESLSLRN